MSKPIWDALEGYLYDNDRAIKLRKAGIRDLRDGIELVDLSRMSADVAGDFLRLIGEVDYLLYIELGKLTPSMFTFASEARYAP